jgi:hypothetical protein
MSENTKQIQSLLDSVSNVIQKHETQANYTGENYNIFSIMGMETDEEFTHSRIIGNLLNPKGKHGCGDFFLKSFVEKLNILFEENNLHDMKLEDFGPLVNDKIVERYAGEVNCKTISGGSIDLVIEDSKQIFLIENKIYAADQKYQLARYFNYAKTRGNKKIVMLYLTLEGKNLSDNEGNILIKEYEVYNIPSIVNLDENAIKLESLELKFPIDQNTFDGINIENKCFYTPISYKTFIKEWLEASFFFVDNRPMIYYPIKHYYNLIKKLTNQTTSKIMEKEILDTIFKKGENIKNALRIANYRIDLGKRLTDLIINEVEKIGMLNNLILSGEKLEGLKKYGMYNVPGYIYEANLIFDTKDNKKIRTVLQFKNEKENQFFIGIGKVNTKYEELQLAIQSIDLIFHNPINYNKSIENWYYGKSFTTDDFINFSNSIEESEPIIFFKNCVEICTKIKNS